MGSKNTSIPAVLPPSFSLFLTNTLLASYAFKRFFVILYLLVRENIQHCLPSLPRRIAKTEEVRSVCSCGRTAYSSEVQKSRVW